MQMERITPLFEAIRCAGYSWAINRNPTSRCTAPFFGLRLTLLLLLKPLSECNHHANCIYRQTK
jgi:hypothetical protein